MKQEELEELMRATMKEVESQGGIIADTDVILFGSRIHEMGYGDLREVSQDE